MTTNVSRPASLPGAATPSAPFATDATWTNWGGNQSATPAFTVRPRNEQEALDAVRFAIREGLPVRAVGSGHSSSPLVQTGGVLMDMAGLSAITGTDQSGRRARALAGTTINAFGDALWEKGLALGNQGDIDKQQIAGALATSTHGSGKNLGSFSSNLRWVKLINGYGEIVEIGESQLRELRAAQVALGTLGIFLEVELAVEDSYYLQEQISYPTWAETASTWQADIDDNRHYSFLWCPEDDSCELLDLPGSPDHSMGGRSYTKRYNVASVQDESQLSAVEGARLDRSYRIYPGGFTTQFHELEYFVRSEDGLVAVEAIQDLIRSKYPEQKYPVEVRWVKSDDAYMSQFQGRDSTVITLTTEPGTDYWQFFRDADAVLQEFEPRAHWGKIHFMTRSRLERLYPELDTFIQVRREFDPRGMFLNDHTRSLLA